MLHKIRFLALLAGLAADILGTLVFSIALGIVAAIIAVRVGMPLKLFYEKTTTDVAFLLVQYMIGITFTFAGAFLTAKLSQPWRRNFYSVKVASYFRGRSAGFMLR